MQYQIQVDRNSSPCAITIVGKIITIPMVEENSDYKAYLKWLEEGNTPEPAENL